MNEKLFKSIFLFGLVLFTFVAYQNCGQMESVNLSSELIQNIPVQDPDISNPTLPNNPNDSVNCNDPLIKPNGFTRSSLGWKEWGGTNQYPPISGSVREIPIKKNEYVTLEVVPQMNSSLGLGTASPQRLNISWSGMYITVSECAGDFRKPVNTSSDVTMRSGCRKFISGGEVFNPIFDTQSPGRGCLLTPGKKYYINMIFSNPTLLSYGTGESTCKDPSGYCGPQYVWE